MTKSRRGDRVLISVLARGETVARAAIEAGVSERTVYRRLAEPEFKGEVARIRGVLMDQAGGRLVASADAAIQCLQDLLTADGETVRLGAARALLDLSLRVREAAEFEQRLQTVELAMEWLIQDPEKRSAPAPS